MSKPILAIDFDGVVHAFTSGFASPTDLPDAPVPGAMAFLAKALEKFDVVIVSPRVAHPGGFEAIMAWLEKYSCPGQVRVWAGRHHPPAFLTLSARAIQFTGTFPEEPKKMLAFRPWHVKGSKVGQPSATWTRVKALYDTVMEANLDGQPFDNESILVSLGEILRETRNGE